jgi:heat shock protein HslJ
MESCAVWMILFTFCFPFIARAHDQVRDTATYVQKIALPAHAVLEARVEDVSGGETCGAQVASEPLENTYWKLTRLGDKPVFVQERQREPNLIFHPESDRVSGSGGCNRLVGSYTRDGKQISFGNFATTKMACADGMDTEDAFLRALTRVRTWKVIGRHLELYDAKGMLLARFEARHMK